jgi:hypothetical protein
MARNAPLPARVTALWFALEGVSMPVEFHAVGQVVMASQNSGAFGLGMRRIRNRLIVWGDMEVWLQTPAVAEIVDAGGAHYSRRLWLDALAKMRVGQNAASAFDLTRPGRRPDFAFSPSENIAAWVECQVRQGVSVEQALNRARASLGSRMPDERVLRDIRRRWACLSSDDIRAMAEVAAIREGIKEITPGV